MIEITVKRTAAQILKECTRRGLVVKLDTFDKKRDGQHWHLGFAGRPGVLEMTDLGKQVVLKVMETRDGGWAGALALELARPRRRRTS